MIESRLFPSPFPISTGVLATSEFLYKVIRKKDFFLYGLYRNSSPKKFICFPSFQYKADQLSSYSSCRNKDKGLLCYL